MEVDGWVGVSGAETSRRETMKQARDQQRQNRRQKWHVGTNRRQLRCVRETKQEGCGFVSQSGKRVFSWSIPYCFMQLTISLADTYTLETHVLPNEVKIRVCTRKHRLFVYACLFVCTCVCACLCVLWLTAHTGWTKELAIAACKVSVVTLSRLQWLQVGWHTSLSLLHTHAHTYTE